MLWDPTREPSERNLSQPWKETEAITYIWIIWVVVEYQRRTNNITKHPSVLLFALEHFLGINGEKVFEVYKGSTFCNGSKFGVFICHSRSGNTRTPSPRSSYLSTISFSDTLSCCHSNLLQKITWGRAALSSQLVNRPKWLNWRVTFPTQPLPSFLHSQLHCLSWVEQIHRELWPCLCLCPCFCLCLCPCPLQLPLLRRVYPEEAQPVDPVEYKEEAGEETEEHQVHPSSPHLFVLQVLSSDKNKSKVFLTFGFFGFFLRPWSASAWLPLGGARLCRAI